MNQHSGQGSPRLLRGPGLDGALGARDVVLRAARLHASDHGRRLRALPEAPLHPDRVRLRLGARADAADGRACTWPGRPARSARSTPRRIPALKELPSFYAQAQLLVRRELPGRRADVEGRDVVGVDKILWGNDYPHYEGCYPYSRENMRFAFADVDRARGAHDARRERRQRSTASTSTRSAPRRRRPASRPRSSRTPLDEIPADSTCITFQRARFERMQSKPGSAKR